MNSHARHAHTRRSNRAVGILEALEGRRLLSGNVTATLDAATATVVVHGDNKANDILIAPGSATAYTITGRNGTTVNGAASADVGAGGIRNFDIDMGNGDDVVEFGHITPGTRYVTNDLAIRTGNGSDTVKLEVRAQGNLDIDTGNGGDDVVLTGSAVGANLKIDTGSGPDSITFAAGDFGDNLVSGNTDIDGGSGPDVIAGIATLHTTGTQTIVDVETVG